MDLDGKPWFHDIKRYLETQEYPEEASVTENEFLRKYSAKFFLSNDVLYRINHDGLLLRCVDKNEEANIIEEIYEGSFGMHSSGHTMANKI